MSAVQAARDDARRGDRRALRFADRAAPVLRELAELDVGYRPCSACSGLGFTAGSWAYGCATCEPKVVTIEVVGSPASKGSGRAIAFRGHARHVPSSSAKNERDLRSWDGAVREAALDQLGKDRKAPLFVERPLEVTIVFRLVRPGGHWGAKGLKASAPAYPSKKPDIDKIARSTIDSLTDLVYDDDSRIAKLALEKQFALPGHEGATIVVRAMT